MQSVNGLSTGLQAPMATQLLLANFLYSPPGLLQIADAHSQLPGWLYEDYRSIYEQTASSSRANSQFNLLQSCLSLTLVLFQPLFRSSWEIAFS